VLHKKRDCDILFFLKYLRKCIPPNVIYKLCVCASKEEGGTAEVMMSQSCFISKSPNQGARSLMLRRKQRFAAGEHFFFHQEFGVLTLLMLYKVLYKLSKGNFFGLERNKKGTKEENFRISTS